MLLRRKVIAFIILSLVIAGGIGYKDYRELRQLYFVVDMETSTPGISQVFFDVGHGYNEHDSHAIQIQRGNLRKYSFPLPEKAINAIRFDPINVSAVIRIKDAKVENKQGDIIKQFPFQDFRPIQQINKMDTSGSTLIIHTIENANDPTVHIEKSSIEVQVGWRDYITTRGWMIIGYGLLVFLFFVGLDHFVIFARRHQYVISGARKLKVVSAANPRKIIAFIGLIAAIVSCYPVVFFDKSFVSPVSVATLYTSPPYVPGFPLDVVGEDFRGSDVAATTWSFAPNTVV